MAKKDDKPAKPAQQEAPKMAAKKIVAFQRFSFGGVKYAEFDEVPADVAKQLDPECAAPEDDERVLDMRALRLSQSKRAAK